MSRAALRALAVVGIAVAPAVVSALNPHLDPTFIPDGCPSCHVGHGEPGSPMMKSSQRQLCLSCHGNQADVDETKMRGKLARGATPQLMGDLFEKAHTHPVSPQAFSSGPGRETVTCTSCHSAHRSVVVSVESSAPGIRKPSPRDPARFEYEMCGDCHGRMGTFVNDSSQASRLVGADNRSFHPIEVSTEERSPSLKAGLSGIEINCTDCHGSDDPVGPRGPHGSSYPFLLKEAYATSDGSEESEAAYALCYRCHDRELVLDSVRFPEHRRHVEIERASCATCHNPHGSIDDRSLIRFGEEVAVVGVSPSGLTGALAFESSAPGSGTCWVTCHGYDHAPATYGLEAAIHAITRPGGEGETVERPPAPDADSIDRPVRPRSTRRPLRPPKR